MLSLGFLYIYKNYSFFQLSHHTYVHGFNRPIIYTYTAAGIFSVMLRLYSDMEVGVSGMQAEKPDYDRQFHFMHVEFVVVYLG